MIDLFWFVPHPYKVSAAVDTALDLPMFDGFNRNMRDEHQNLENLCNDAVVGRDIVEGSCIAYLSMVARLNALDVDFCIEDDDVVVAVDPIYWFLALWIDDNFCELWSGPNWFPLAAIG